jgi:tetratricopeptide (TPR) repeat protein
MVPSVLSPEQASHLEQILDELQPFVEAELYPQALERIDVILAGIPESDDYRRFRGAILARRAEMALDNNDNQAAWLDAQRAMNAGWYDAAVHAIAGWAMLDEHDHDRAAEQFSLGLSLDATHVSSLLGVAMLELDAENWPDALAHLGCVLQNEPGHSTALAMRSEIYCLKEDFDQALSEIVEARSHAGKDPDLLLAEARIRYVLDQAEQSARLLDTLLGQEGDAMLEARLFRACLKLIDGDGRAAQKDAIQASNTFPDDPFSFVVLSLVQLAQEKGRLARKAAERAIELDPSLPDGYFALAEALRQLGLSGDAEVEMERVEGTPPEIAALLLGPTASTAHATAFLAALHGSHQPTRPSEPEPSSREKPKVEKGSAPPFDPSVLLDAGGGGLNMMALLGQICDEEGNIRPLFRPVLRMALKNAPAMLKGMPPAVLDKMGGLDPELLKKVDLGSVTEEEFAAQLKTLYRVLKQQE